MRACDNIGIIKLTFYFFFLRSPLFVRRHRIRFFVSRLSNGLDWWLLSRSGRARHRSDERWNSYKSRRDCSVKRGTIAFLVLPHELPTPFGNFNHKLGQTFVALLFHLILMDGTWFKFNCLRFFTSSSILFPTGKSDGWGTWQTTWAGLQAGEGTEKCRKWKQEEQTTDLKREVDCDRTRKCFDHKNDKKKYRRRSFWKTHDFIFCFSILLTLSFYNRCPNPNFLPTLAFLVANGATLFFFYFFLFRWIFSYFLAVLFVTNLCAF